MIQPSSETGTDIDYDNLERDLKQRQLGGMTPVIRMLGELGMDTYESLIPFLQQANQYGHFEFSTTDASFYRRFMGNGGEPDAHPSHSHLVIEKEVIAETVEALRDIREKIQQEVRQNMMDVLNAPAPVSDDTGKDSKPNVQTAA